MITTELISDANEFRSIEAEWSELLKQSSQDCLFLTWDWMYTWWEHLADHRTLRLILVRRDGLLIAIAPLALCPPRFKRLILFRALEFLGSGSVGADYLSVIVRRGHEDDATSAIGSWLDMYDQMMELVRIEKYSAVMFDMRLQLYERGWNTVSRAITRCPYVELSSLTWESYLHSLDRGHQKYLARKLRKIHRDFEVELKVASTGKEVEDTLDWLVEMHMSRWSQRGGSTAFNSDALVNFHREFSRRSLEKGWLRLYSLLLNGVVAAAVYAFSYNNVTYYYQMAFDTEFGNYSVGMIALAMVIRRSIEEGTIEFDFLHDDEAYKLLWARELRELIRLECYPPDVPGRIQRQISQAKASMNSVLNSQPVRSKGIE